MNIDQQHPPTLPREDIQRACRTRFWTLAAAEFSLYERLELMNRVGDYLESIDADWLTHHELEALLHLHGLLLDWLEPGDDASLGDSTNTRRWTHLAGELDINATVAGPSTGTDQKSKLDVIEAELLLPSGEEEATVIVRVKTRAGQVLEFDMALPWEAIVDATDDYDEVEGEPVKHDFDMADPEEVDRYFGRRR